jgi:short-subunit dehydrogenase
MPRSQQIAMTISTTAPARPVAVVTGASSGIGAAFARRLAADDHDLVLVARRQERLEALAQELDREHGVHAAPLVADLGTPAGCNAVAARIQAAPIPAIVINSAGFGGYGRFVDLTSDDLEALLGVHVQAVTRLAHAAATAMIARGAGAIINVTSRLALSGTLPPHPLPYRSVYAAAKSFQLAFSQTLAGELVGSGVRVQALLPGVVRTEFHGAAGPAIPPDLVMEPEEIVEASLAALERDEVVCAPGLADPNLLGLLGKVERAIVMGPAWAPS